MNRVMLRFSGVAGKPETNQRGYREAKMRKNKEGVARRTMFAARSDKIIPIKDFKLQLDLHEVKEIVEIPDGFGGKLYLLHLPSSLPPPLPPWANPGVLSSKPVEPEMTREEYAELRGYMARKTAELTQDLKSRTRDIIELAVFETSLLISLEVLKAAGVILEPDFIINQAKGITKLRFRYSARGGYLDREIIGRKGENKTARRFRNRTHFLREARRKAKEFMEKSGKMPIKVELAYEMYPRHGSPLSEFRDDLKRFEVSFKDEIKGWLNKGSK